MGEPQRNLVNANERQLREEIARLNKVVRALMNRAERSMVSQDSEFSIFQTRLLLERKVHERTAELEAAFRENQKIYQALKESESSFRALVNQSLVGIGLIESDHCVYANPKLAALFGYPVEELARQKLADMVAPEELTKVSAQIAGRFAGKNEKPSFQFVGRRRDGSTFEVESHAQVIDMEGRPVLLTVMIDVTDRMKEQRQIEALQARLKEQALRDPLTGLYNRLAMNEFFDRELRVAVRSRKGLCVILADIDFFKRINDTWGHLVGDRALEAFSELLRGACRASDIVCRYGGEEFLILMPDMELESAKVRAELIRTLIESSLVVCDAGKVNMTASFGVSAYPEHGATREELVEAADRALYVAKNRGRNLVVMAELSITGSR